MHVRSLKIPVVSHHKPFPSGLNAVETAALSFDPQIKSRLKLEELAG
jgi:hypothetical protein